jgi:hypothetical protein
MHRVARVVTLSFVALATLGGCKKKKPEVAVTPVNNPPPAAAPTPTPAETERGQRLSDARTVIAAIAAKPRNERSAVERALLGLAVAVREVDA